ncbi:spore germination protein [Paenibacillus durus]|uniref:Spore gernimation protein KB n=1 Tax=Paenibacillus durus ATCC 35681 TaxID=1333534 RepID=A0A0F7F8L9_PAEDU|nr:spore germination protein [Paenibacillus durus]AKG34523.1 spore gernimation protein KB [Paenibacillus durus ATCC 35681]
MSAEKTTKRGKPGGGTGGDAPRAGVVRAISEELTETLDRIEGELGGSPDLKIRKLVIGAELPIRAAVVHISGLADDKTINDFVIGSLTRVNQASGQVPDDGSESLLEFVMERVLESGDAEIKEDWNDIVLAILSGDTAILLNGCASAILCATRGGENRAIAEPSMQLVLRGPKDSFVESIGTNISLVRRRIKTPKLWMEHLTVGDASKTHVAMLFIQGTVDDKLVDEVRTRINKIKIDAILESGYIEELIEDKTFSPFPTIYNTERPDVVAANLLEGRVVLIVDGTPFALILPAVFTQFFQSPADYSQRVDIAILMRLIRYGSFLILLFGPSMYIALTTFHYEMIPTVLLISLLAQRENVPFPAFVEALLMEGVFEILREAGIRMPRAVGQTVSVVGGLILGQAAVEAGFVTPAMVIVVALTGIASFAIPAYNMSIAGRIVRFGFMLLAGMFGFYGITLGMIVTIAHMNSLRSFGIPYLSPFVPLSIREQQDAVLRLPLWFIRPGTVSPARSGENQTEKGKLIDSGHEDNLAPAIQTKGETGLMDSQEPEKGG